MQRLGYNEQTLLENAYNQQAVWDLSDQPGTTPGVAMHRALRLGDLSDGLDEDEGMCCATPELGSTSDTDDADQVRIVLMAKVDDAVAQGMDDMAVEVLRTSTAHLKPGSTWSSMCASW
ncbi:hypothetical protein H310_12048 [Aphanomyces invadans]|uniref:Uncharacterized protein n=1 Tax=Aphanomyces invadans TaxID=157072 RepID=A0A024TJW7_9STRA|nr:hypothetical protein H310_12048 [Aphanomyces invadans]ETV94420.1 hypothetical protein H310_12048 [Aphanomyces invadans]|eukprot:XP_008877182.1 hypothetical protein H310_12048 [Aphanomyces invadans]